MKGRHLVDGFVVVNEFIDMIRKSRRDYLIFNLILKRPMIQLVGDFWTIC